MYVNKYKLNNIDKSNNNYKIENINRENQN